MSDTMAVGAITLTEINKRDLRIAELEGRLHEIIEPGKLGARFAALEKLAEPMGYSQVSSRPVEDYVRERIERLESELAAMKTTRASDAAVYAKAVGDLTTQLVAQEQETALQFRKRKGVESELAGVRKERDVIAASLRLAHDQMEAAGWQPDVIESTMGLDACKRALELHDAALVKPLMEALRDTLAALPPDVISHTVWGKDDRGEIVYRPWYLAAQDALTPYKQEAPDGPKD